MIKRGLLYQGLLYQTSDPLGGGGEKVVLRWGAAFGEEAGAFSRQPADQQYSTIQAYFIRVFLVRKELPG